MGFSTSNSKLKIPSVLLSKLEQSIFRLKISIKLILSSIASVQVWITSLRNLIRFFEHLKVTFFNGKPFNIRKIQKSQEKTGLVWFVSNS